MTQRIFDIQNEKDMEDLWNILPDGFKKISCNKLSQETSLWSDLNFFTLPIGLIKINWHDKTEITRPIQEATFDDVGKLCVFWEKGQHNAYGVLESVVHTKKGGYDYQSTENRLYSHCRRLTKREIEELC